MTKVQDLTPKWKNIPTKERVLSLDSDFGERVGGLGSPTVKSVKDTQEQTEENTTEINNITNQINIIGWSSNLVFSSIDYNTVAWSSGNVILKDGTSFAITGDNTGNISTVTYIYFDKDVSETDLQTSTDPADSVGENRILIAVAQDNLDTSSNASFQVFGGAGGFMVTRDGIAAGTITGDRIAANTINVNQIIAGTFTGFTFRTAASGTRVEITAANNDLVIYDNANPIISLGSYNNSAIDINLISSPTVNADNGISVDSSVGGVGYYYTNASDTNSIGLKIVQSSTGSNTTNPAIDIDYRGKYYAQYIGTQATAGGLIMSHNGTGRAIYLISYNTTGNVIDVISNGVGATALSIVQSSGTTSNGHSLVITNITNQEAVLITQAGNGPALKIASTGNFVTTIDFSDTVAGNLLYLKKSNSGRIVYAEANINSASPIYGLTIDVHNTGAGGAYAFEFSGNNTTTSSVGGSQNRKINVSVGGTNYYIPLYTA